MSDPCADNKRIKNKKAVGRDPAAKVAIAAAWIAGGAVIMVALLACIATWLLTPTRLTDYINRKASDMLEADITAHNVRFTVWSSFPHFCLETDSLKVVSRTLRTLPDSLRRKLPEDADLLASSGHIRGEINILKLLAGKIWLRDIEVENVNINLVSATDSLSNYMIWSSDKGGKIPFFTARSIKLVGPGEIRYFSLPGNTCATIGLRTLLAARYKDSTDSYRLDLDGRTDARVNNLELLSGFPFSLGGNVRLAFNPFRVSVANYGVRLGNTRGEIDMALCVGENTQVNRFSYRLGDFSLNEFLSYLPPALLPFSNSVSIDLIMNASARLTSPYSFSETGLPSLVIDCRIPKGEIGYTTADGTEHAIWHSNADARLVFDPQAPDSSYIRIPEFCIKGQGTDIRMRALISDITGYPRIRLGVRGDADASIWEELTGKKSPYRINGRIHTDAIASLTIADLKQSRFLNTGIDGHLSLENFTISNRPAGISASGKSLDLRFSSKAPATDKGDIRNPICGLSAEATELAVTDNYTTANFSSIRFSGKMDDRNTLDIDRNKHPLPVRIMFETPEMTIGTCSSSDILSLRDMSLDGKILTSPGKTTPQSFGVRITARQLAVSSKPAKADAEHVSAHISGRPSVVSIRRFKTPKKWNADAPGLAAADNPERFITAKLPERIRRIMERWEVTSRIKIGSGQIRSRVFPLDNRFYGLDIIATSDSINVSGKKFRTGNTAMRMSAGAGNLRQFLSSSVPAPLNISLNLDFDTVQINQLAAAYERGKRLTGNKEAAIAQRTENSAGTDTVTRLIPRNIVADMHIAAKETRYMNLRLYNLGTDIGVKDGDASINRLRISSDFGEAAADFSYSTSDITRLGISADIAVEDINVVNFFKNFHTLLLMMPQMKNLSGDISARAEARMLMFPNMYVNVPSVWADLYLRGAGLKVHQDTFIRKIARMMLIHDSSDIHIRDMSVHASVHDNLLELYPFGFSFSRYRINMGGLNNFDGKMYYHIGIEKSPMPFPFGINIVGMFSHPEIRFGGADYKVVKGSEITASVMEEKKINIVGEFRKYMKEFIRKAAESDTTSNYVY